MRSDIQKLLFEMRERPNDFQMDEFCLMHVPTRQEIWVCSGFGFYGLYSPYKIKFTFADKVRFATAFRRFRLARRVSERNWLRNFLCEPTTIPIKIKIKQ